MTAAAFPRISTPAGSVPDQAAFWNRQRRSQMPSHRYVDVYSRVEVPLIELEWPTKRLTTAPLWVPVDLRDGNQALAEPMDPARKRRFFELMVAMGYKEIEVGYSSASQTDFDLVRLIAETDLAPEDVTIVVFTPARRDLIERTVASIQGIRNEVVIHMYTATASTWRDIVLGCEQADLKQLILSGGRDVLEFAGEMPNVRFEFSPGIFDLIEPDHVLEVCDAMTELWDASPERPVILNLPATVEVATPNVYADQVEYMHKNLARRDSVTLSVHPHNDRGTGVARAELAMLAGARRVEGCIFGNGERTGNVDIATLALNLHAQGIDPMIDFSDIDEVRRTVEHCNRIEVHARHPYVGDLVHTAFSGTHQDAIKKGFAEHRALARDQGRPESDIAWRVPYLPIDLAGRVQQHTDDSGAEITAQEIWNIFKSGYFDVNTGRAIELAGYETTDTGGQSSTRITLRVRGEDHTSSHDGICPVEALTAALTAALAAQAIRIEVLELHQTNIGQGNDSEALTIIEYRHGGGVAWAAGQAGSVLAASMAAVIGAANASEREMALTRS